MPSVNTTTNAQVARLVDAGAPIGDAIRIALAQALGVDARSGVTVFAERHKLARANTAAAIYGKRSAPADLLEALVQELGGTREGWAELIWLGAKPSKVA